MTGEVLGGPGDNLELAGREAAALVATSKVALLPVETANNSSLGTLSPAALVAKANPTMETEIGGGAAALDAHDIDLTKTSSSKLPRLANYFIQPASGINWGTLHPHNGVDIANACNTPVVAAAAGVVVAADGSTAWNGGYGNFVEIEHPNGVKTKYAHMNKVTVSPGDAVRQGEEIGALGNTGRVTGATGCHLHFEVDGAANPFARS